jgi:excisionase family DNA binding protein
MTKDQHMMSDILHEIRLLSQQVSRLTTKVENPDRIKYDVNEACERLNVSRSTIYRLRDTGKLKLIREGGRVYTTEREIVQCETQLREHNGQ